MDALMMFAATGEPTTWEWLLSYAWMILSVAVGLGFVIFVHELGHFLVAKACGVKCEKFYIGFDIFNLRFCRFQWGETEYGIGALPLGGYVKMLGQDDDPRNAMTEAERCKVPAADGSDEGRAAALAEGTSAEGLTPGATVEQPQATYELDPRSYPAKPVLSRMAIISAGVIMNVIFGAVLGAWAYWLGVEELPAIVGSTVPGGPAWTANLRPGMKFIRFGDGPVYENYRFVDVKQNIIFGGAGENLEFTVRTRDGDEKSFVLRPTARAKKETKFPTIGYHQADSAVLMEKVDHLKPSADVELQAGDRVVEINGIQLNKGTPTREVFDYRLNAELARSSDRPVTLTIERQSETESGEPGKLQRLQVKVERKPNRTVGMVMQIGPIVAIRDGSPAQQAGFQVGDIIKEVNGSPVGDPLSLGQRLIPQNESEEWTFVVSRKAAGGATVSRTLTVTPQPPDQYFEAYGVGGPSSIESIGVAFAVTHKVAAVEPNSAAQKAGIKPGDVVTKAALVPASDADREKEREFYGKEIHQVVVLDDDVFSWTRIHYRLQLVLPTTALKVTVKRGDREIEATLAPHPSERFFSESRGLAFVPVVTTHQASSLGESLYLGVREIKEGMVNVVATVSALLTGKVSGEHVTGPLGILQTAGKIAQSGLPELLIFLTLLSANLAVLNILPIPVLDGGHLLFLTWEGITRKPVNPNVQGYLSLAGLVLLLLLMLYATKNDITRFFS